MSISLPGCNSDQGLATFIMKCCVYGCNEVEYGTSARWIRKFKGRILLIEDAPKSGRKKSAITPKNIHKGNDLIARYTVGDTCTYCPASHE